MHKDEDVMSEDQRGTSRDGSREAVPKRKHGRGVGVPVQLIREPVPTQGCLCDWGETGFSSNRKC